jgi:GT2 family glycosyltransferase
MTEFEKNITFVIVCFRSDHIIDQCLKSINPHIKVVIVENSNNSFIKDRLEKKFSNVRVLISGDNIGYGRGNNLGLKKVKTEYAFIISPDAYLHKNTLLEIKKSIDLTNFKSKNDKNCSFMKRSSFSIK